jgi:hypothetical protein
MSPHTASTEAMATAVDLAVPKTGVGQLSAAAEHDLLVDHPRHCVGFMPVLFRIVGVVNVVRRPRLDPVVLCKGIGQFGVAFVFGSQKLTCREVPIFHPQTKPKVLR